VGNADVELVKALLAAGADHTIESDNWWNGSALDETEDLATQKLWNGTDEEIALLEKYKQIYELLKKAVEEGN
jgi:hypothetical protein